MARTPNTPTHCSGCGAIGHKVTTCATKLAPGLRRCACGDIYTPGTPKQTRCPGCHRAYAKMSAMRREEESAA